MNDDDKMLEEACRRLARRYKLDARRAAHSLSRGSALKKAAHFERVANNIKRAKETETKRR